MPKGTTVRMWRRSLFILIFLVILGFGTVIGRLAKLQLVDGEELQKMAIDQQLADTKINAQRGTIYDCNMKPLAQSATVWTVVLEPAHINDEKDKELISSGLAEILEVDKQELIKKLSNKKSYYAIAKAKVENDVKDKIIKFKNDNKITKGIRLIEDYKRYYPYGEFAAAVLGFTGAESQGLGGIEAYYDKYLKGQAGRLVTARNAIGTDMPFDYEQLVPAKDGYSLVLSIDEVIQHFLEKNLEEGIINHKVKNRATAIIMDVNTGEIKGMAVKGDFDPNKPFEIADENVLKEIEALPEAERKAAKRKAMEEQWRNKAVSDTYYPGSVFKMFTSAMGFEENVLTEESRFVCTGGMKPFPGARYIKCHKRAGHGSQNFVEALCHSCNPAFMMIGQKVGAEKFYHYYSAFGFSEKTGIDLPGEASDIFFSADGSMAPMDLAVASFGQNFSVTPMQMLTAMASIANGGKLVKPHVVSKIIDSEGNIVKSIDTVVKRQAISKETSRRICNILQTNATIGSGKNGYVAGYRVAGKTGTSEKIGKSGPDGMDYISSFGGFAPADNPRFVMLVFFDTPKGANYYGSAVAAPVFAKVMEEVLPYEGIERVYTEEELAKLSISAPNVIDKSLSSAKNEIISLGLTPIVLGGGEKVISQIPSAYKQVPKGGTVVLYTDTNSENDKTTVPNLIGLTMSAANKLVTDSNLNINIKGAGLTGGEVVSSSQSIEPGTQVAKGTVITVEFIQKDQIH